MFYVMLSTGARLAAIARPGLSLTGILLRKQEIGLLI